MVAAASRLAGKAGAAPSAARGDTPERCERVCGMNGAPEMDAGCVTELVRCRPLVALDAAACTC